MTAPARQRPASDPPAPGLDAPTFLDRLMRAKAFANQVVHVEKLPARAAQTVPLPPDLPAPLTAVLARLGIATLYAHQAAAVAAARAGENLVVVTGTASGKTLCYTLPALEAVLATPGATTLFIYPTKALTQDQLRVLTAWQAPDLEFLAGTYDGDTPANLRRHLRDHAQFLLTNPDMLHQGILPQHPRWNRFFAHLKYVVLDEIHAYRGVFGSHLANVMRRLHRICRHYGSQPQFICSSATIANPREHAERLCGVPMHLIANDGSPRGPKTFVLWNPPPLKTAASGPAGAWRVGGDRRSSRGEAVALLSALVREGIQTIAFVRTRLAAELICKNTRERLAKESPRLADAVQAYRGGYLPAERRAIEQQLARREILGVASTNALELGIDIGSLDACVLVGYPGSVASLWQQAGRAGRGRDESLVFFVAQNAPLDQYLMANAGYLFAQPPEHAIVDPDNPHLVVGHLKCAANELPLADAEVAGFGACAGPVLELLAEDKLLRHLDGHWYWASSEYPAAGVNLRNIAGPVYTIQDQAGGAERVIGTLDEISALAQLHDHAVYLHRAETYFVTRLDLEQKIAFVERRDLDYYTQAVQVAQLQLDRTDTETDWQGGRLGFGDVTVTTAIPMFKKIRFHARDSLGFEKLDLPPQLLETVACWFVPPDAALAQLRAAGLLMGEALTGIANVVIEVAPMFVLCDPQDIGTVVDAHNLGRDTLFVHDRYPGGIGYARRLLDNFPAVMAAVANVVRHCSCPDGCPSCVGSALPAAAMTDLDSAVRGRIPNKAAARCLVAALLGPG